MRRVVGWIGRALSELARGLGLIARDIHRALYRRYGARVWWVYIAGGWLFLLWRSGQLWGVVFSLLTLGLVLFGLWLMVSAPFRRARGRGR